jgi:hypothetical protein
MSTPNRANWPPRRPIRVLNSPISHSSQSRRVDAVLPQALDHVVPGGATWRALYPAANVRLVAEIDGAELALQVYLFAGDHAVADDEIEWR